jgi:nucleotide-binding universal stress UspA family protein
MFIMMFKKILLGVDGSEHSLRAAEKAAAQFGKIQL